MTYNARPAQLAKRIVRNAEYGPVDDSYKGKTSKLWGAVNHGVAGTPIGAVMGYKHQGRANKARQAIGGSPEHTPSDLKGRAWRNVGFVTGGTVSSAVGRVAGMGVGGAVGAAVGGKTGAAIGSGIGGNFGNLVGGIKGGIEGHRRVRDSQIYTRDFKKGVAEGALNKVSHPTYGELRTGGEYRGDKSRARAWFDGGVMAMGSQKRANRLYQEIGGSPENTPEGLKGRPKRILGAIIGGKSGHRAVRDAQLYERDFKKSFNEAEAAIPLEKNWRAKLPAILEAVQAIQEAEKAGMADDLQLDSEDVLRLVNRVVAHVRSQGAARLGKSHDATLDTMLKGAPDLALLHFAAMHPDEQADFLGEGDAVLAQLDELHKAAGGEGGEQLQKRALDMDRLMKGVGDPELVKFWGAVAAGAGRVGAAVGQAASRWAGTIKGTMGPRLSALMGSAKQAGQNAARRVSNFAAGPAQGSLPMQGGGMGGMAGAARRGMAGAKAFGQQAVRQPMATAGNAARGLGRHVMNNRGGYGLAAGLEVGQRMSQPRQPQGY